MGLNKNQREMLEFLDVVGKFLLFAIVMYTGAIIAILLLPLDIVTLFYFGIWHKTMEKSSNLVDRWCF